MIISTGNLRVKEARKLHRKHHRDITGLLLVEGVRLLQDAVELGIKPHYVFYVPVMAETNVALSHLLRKFAQMDVACLRVSAQVFDTLARTVTPQGIAAVLPQSHRPPPARPCLALILDRVREPGNAGTLLRGAEAAGADLALFAPGTVDPFNDKVVRAGMGAHFRLPIQAPADWEQLNAALSPEVALYVADVNAAMSYDQVDWQRPSALVVGGEVDGPSDLALSLACPITIPMYGGADSLNAAMAGTVILFEAARQRRLASCDIDRARKIPE